MTAINRRRFIQLAGGTAAFTAMSGSIARAAAIPAARRTGTMKDVEHIVVLMQENRSFDHYFGTLRGVRGYGDPIPVNLPSGKSVWYQSDGTKEILPFHPEAANLGLQFLEDLAHDWNTTHWAWNNGAWDQWIPAKTATTMAYLTRDDIPFHYALADAFTICDAYHCSLMTCTDPNRYYMWTGYTGNDGKGDGPVLDNAEAGYNWTTYPERLEQGGVSWKIYQDAGTGLDANGYWGWTDDAYIGNYGDNSLLYFDNYRNAQPGDPLYEKARTGTNVSEGGGFFDILKSDVQSGKLPQISWIVAPEAFTEHPNWPANYGAWYISQALDALTSDPEVWAKTALFITFDENDGFFDHMVPPVPPFSADQGASTVDVSGELYTDGVSAASLFAGGSGYLSSQYGLGPRVPMLVVSPWSKGGYVNSQVFDHTSIIRFMEERFGVGEPNISDWRRAVCGDLTSAFDFSLTDSKVPALPDTSSYQPPDANRHDDYVPTPPVEGTLPVQEPGTRLARPLPYDLAVDGKVDAASGTLSLHFANFGTAGANWQVRSSTDTSNPETITGETLSSPWTYTVEAGKSLTGSWDIAAGASGKYEYSAYGPNGFLRRFAGSVAAAGPEVTARHDGDHGHVRLDLVNNGTTTVHLTVKDAYGTVKPTTVTLRHGATREHTFVVGATHGWYDLTVTSAEDGSFVRRLTGHVENGRVSISDPAIGAAV